MELRRPSSPLGLPHRKDARLSLQNHEFMSLRDDFMSFDYTEVDMHVFEHVLLKTTSNH